MAEMTSSSVSTVASSSLSPVRAMAERLGLRYVTVDRLTIRRRRQGSGFYYLTPDGRAIRDPRTRQRLQRLAVPPAYEDVFYADDPDAHIQAIGRDAAGRLQYRYHARWQSVREAAQGAPAAHLVEALPRIRRSIGRHLARDRAERAFALVRRDRAGHAQRDPARARELRADERHARRRDPAEVERRRGRRHPALSVPRQGRQGRAQGMRAPRLAAAIDVLRAAARPPRLPVPRARTAPCAGSRRSDVNAFLREIAGAPISLKDFRTLCASTAVLDALARMAPAASERRRRRQVRDAVTAVSRSSPTRRRSAATAMCTKPWLRRSRAASWSGSAPAEGMPLGGAARTVAGASGGVGRGIGAAPASVHLCEARFGSCCRCAACPRRQAMKQS